MRDNWKETISQLNYSYLALVREIIQSGDDSSLGLLGLDSQAVNKLAKMDNGVLKNLANIGVTVFRLRQEQIDRILEIASTGQDQRAQALIMMEAILGTGESCG